ALWRVPSVDCGDERGRACAGYPAWLLRWQSIRDCRRRLQVLAGAARVRPLRLPWLGSGGKSTAAQLFELCPRGGLLREQRGLDPVEQPFEPPDELRLRDADLGLRGHVVHRRRQGIELFAEVGRQDVGELVDRPFV